MLKNKTKELEGQINKLEIALQERNIFIDKRNIFIDKMKDVFTVPLLMAPYRKMFKSLEKKLKKREVKE